MQVTNAAARVARSVARPVLAPLFLVRWYGYDEALAEAWGLFKLQERLMMDVAQEQVAST